MARLNTDGSLDESFGDDGKVINISGYEFTCLGLQQDGKIIAGGHLDKVGAGDEDMFSVSRYNTDGSLDESFGREGTVLTNVSNADDIPYALQVLSDEKILVAGRAHFGTRMANSYMAVVKYGSSKI